MFEIVYNEELMDNIANQYKEAACIVEDSISGLDSFETQLNDMYKGQASDEILPALVSKIKELLQLLKLCYESAETYVSTSKETMLQLDKWKAQIMQVSGIHGEEN